MFLHAALEPLGEATDDAAGKAPSRADRRGATRRSLRLKARADAPSIRDALVVVHDISAQGLLVESAPGVLAKNDILTIDLPELGQANARVIWQSGPFSGCAFARPISTGALSAALLKSELRQRRQPGSDRRIGLGQGVHSRPVYLGSAFLLSAVLWSSIALLGFVLFSTP